jgi:hypothetical protein
MEFESPGNNDLSDLERRREAVRALVGLDHAPLLLDLQRLLDTKQIQPDAAWMLEAVGVCFGDMLAADGSFHWQILIDDYGRAAVLRPRDAELVISPMDMIARRVEEGETVDLELLRRQLLSQVADLMAEY